MRFPDLQPFVIATSTHGTGMSQTAPATTFAKQHTIIKMDTAHTYCFLKKQSL